MDDATPRDLIGIVDAVRLTGLDKHTIYRLARCGRLRSYRVLGRALRFSLTDVQSLVKVRPVANPGVRRR